MTQAMLSDWFFLVEFSQNRRFINSSDMTSLENSANPIQATFQAAFRQIGVKT
jgi:hypothetical protein